jgi:hypothetical protein
MDFAQSCGMGSLLRGMIRAFSRPIRSRVAMAVFVIDRGVS